MAASRTGNEQERAIRRMKADVFKAMGHPLRLAIAEALADGEACVCKLAEAVGAERSNVSRHLAVMVKAGALASRKQGLMVYYSLKTRCVLNFFTCVENLLREQLTANTRTLSRLKRSRRKSTLYA
jgi:ArsR family transcriptional regulator